jgi:hypothetical protein
MELIQRASWLAKQGKGGLDAGGQKIQFILQKKIIRLDFLFLFHQWKKKDIKIEVAIIYYKC